MEDLMRKGEIACNKQFLFFSRCFLPLWHLFFILNAHQKVVCNLFQFRPESKILLSGNGLNIEKSGELNLKNFLKNGW